MPLIAPVAPACVPDQVRQLVARAHWERVLEYPIHQANRIIARKGEAARAYLYEWLRLCSLRELLEPEPNPEPHPEFQWHTPEQCLFSLLAAQRPEMYQRNLAFCYQFVPGSTRSVLGDGASANCPKPSSVEIRSWLPRRASRHGRCLVVQCPELRTACNHAHAQLAWSFARSLSSFARSPGSAPALATTRWELQRIHDNRSQAEVLRHRQRCATLTTYNMLNEKRGFDCGAMRVAL